MRNKRISDVIEAVSEDEEDGARASRRIPVDAEVKFLHPHGIRGQAVDVNQGGMRVLANGELTPGQKCVAEVQLATGDSTHERLEVIWARRSPRGWEIGLQFAS